MNRILYSDGSTLTDYSSQLSNYYNDSLDITMDTDHAIYVGCVAPFNNIFLKVATASVNTFNFNVNYYGGTSFVPMVNTIDETNMLKNSGLLNFTTNARTGSWSSADTEDITELNSIIIYERYWLKITVDASTGPISLKWLGQIFSDDNDLGTEYPDLTRSSLMDAFESGKTDWEEQSVRAAEIIVKDLIAMKVINSKCQILDVNKLMLASTSKIANMVFNALGDDYADNKKDANIDYKNRLDLRLFNVDLDGDGRLDKDERLSSTGWLSR